MARVQLFLCFTILFASVTLLDIVSAHLKLKPTLPQIEPPQTLKDVEPYTVKVVIVFVSDLEKECPKTNKFKAFFEKLRAFAKYVCPIKRKDQVDYDRDMKAKAGGLFQVISSFAIGKIKKEIQEDKMEVINTFKFMRFLATKIVGSRKKEESEESMKLTAEQQKEIKEGILRWETIITRITNTMVSSTTNSASSNEESSVGKEASSENSKSSGKESESSAKGESETSAKGESKTSAKGESETSSSKSAGGSSTSATKEESSASQSSGVTVTQVEEETSKDVSTFIMNLEKKCPQKEEYKVFFEQLKGTMIAPPKERKGLFSRIKSAAGKLSGAMGVMRSRIGSKSAEVKKSMETYQEQVMKTLQELDTIHSQIVSQNQGKKEGSLTCTPAQQTQIKTTITKWEQVTTQFVETAIQSETKSSSTTSSSVGKMNTN
ncbi:unnamed protein product [Arabidopsis thaliana]|uniref:DUF1216 domain-containing protein n=2 Tax=Arabidopsis thaliana TaxID=3702 RepID=A0A654FBM6_ARATH|nr:mediator of RNA polymerase II transcription subunit-like protein, putative (DUF1216) [Arabidopsis thaliana]AEE77492.1 mediator of RNA polymerase II transcription subunit-like protein, putative (DUF1216) [Arabidopsis thaliana]BAB03179.1 unnamed protein product [Arabidopsis thaliana]VYS58943.1 unnamed protein product [Arabidopsis thaliana]|eukprot:NP_189523.1 mediator of RNA polymerase II transcription subunit-like protein, putative (DUF1216) [Arabidopsis thaliana]